MRRLTRGTKQAERCISKAPDGRGCGIPYDPPRLNSFSIRPLSCRMAPYEARRILTTFGIAGNTRTLLESLRHPALPAGPRRNRICAGRLWIAFRSARPRCTLAPWRFRVLPKFRQISGRSYGPANEALLRVRTLSLRFREARTGVRWHAGSPGAEGF